MQVSTICIRDIENRWESLTLSLQAIARWAGVELHFRSINAALGLSFMISAPRDREVSLAWWMTLGRDAFLVETAEMFGIKVRRLDLPQVITAKPGQPEAFQVFDELIRPQIEATLAENRPLLAWQGWPDYHSYLWGIITERHPSELGLAGTTMWAGQKRLPLAAPPSRLYVVEEADPRQPDGDELLRFALRNIRAVVHNDIDPEFGVVTGLPAYDRWLACLAEHPRPGSGAQGTATCHHQMARFVTYNRESACRFIDHYRDGLHVALHPHLAAMLADCNGVINALATARDLPAVEVLYSSPDGRRALAAGVHAARDFLEAQIKTVDHLAEELRI